FRGTAPGRLDPGRAPHGRMVAGTASGPSRPGHGIWTGLLRDPPRLPVILGTLLHGRSPGRPLRAHLAPAARQAAASHAHRRDPSGPVLVLLPGDAFHRRARPAGPGPHSLVPGRPRVDPRSRGR